MIYIYPEITNKSDSIMLFILFILSMQFFKFKQIAAGLLPDLLCYFAGVAVPRKTGDKDISLALHLHCAAQGYGRRD